MRDSIRQQVQAVDAAALLPHHRRGALFILAPEVDLLDVAVAIAEDNSKAVTELLEGGRLTRPTLGELADWCVDTSLRFQFVILQPYVLAQPLPKSPDTPRA